MSQNITILLPVYNDANSLEMLLKDMQQLESSLLRSIGIVIVDDGSAPFKISKVLEATPIQIIRLSRNMGHQKAIAIGLSYIKEHIKDSKVIVMDSDGEDRVQDIPTLLDAHQKNPDAVIFASRKRRTNGIGFKLFYLMYKVCFYLFTGKRISFGNFSLLPETALNRIVYYSEIWNNYPGGTIKSGIPYQTIPAARGNRYFGKSKMNFTSLLLHGFGAIAVFLETIIIRIAIVSFLLILISLVSIIAILVIRTTTTLAVPGWASTLGSSMFIILLINFIISLITLFIYLSTQSQKKFIPALHYRDYILHIETI